MIVQDFLRAHGLGKLCADYGLLHSRHSRYPQLVLLKYHQTESPMHEPIVQHCRGLIVDELDNWRIVAWPYNKFFNYGESKAAAIDWSTAEVYEKLDGSLITLYHYRGEWHVATSGKPDASGEVKPGLTFADLFWRTFSDDFQFYDRGSTYMFELCCPENRIVVQHAEPRVYLHGARDIYTGREWKPGAITRYAPSYPLRSIEEVIEFVNSRNPLAAEGCVVVDAQFNRIKVKSDAYVALHHSKDSHSRRRLANIIRAGEAEEFHQALDAFPAMRADFEDLSGRYQRAVRDMDLVWSVARHIDERPAFAKAVKELPYSGYLFQKKSGKEVTPTSWLAGLSEASYLRLLEGA